MTYKVNDLVYFDGDGYKGVGKVVAVHEFFTNYYKVHSTQLKKEYNGMLLNRDWWCFSEDDLKPFTKKVGQKYKVIGNVDEDAEISIGDIITLISIENDNLSYYESENVPSFLMYDLDHPKCEVEFYEDAPSAKEDEMFTKDDLKAGYLVKIRDGRFVHVVDTIQKGMCLNFVYSWHCLDNYNRDLTHTKIDSLDIVEVYGYTRYGLNAHKFEIGNRELLWKREEVKEMTIEDIQKALGRKIKVVE